MQNFTKFLAVGLSMTAASCHSLRGTTDDSGSRLMSENSERINVAANHCEIYIEKLQAAPSSHGSASLVVIAKVPWLGNGELIQKVGFFGRPTAEDLGNNASCHAYAAYNEAIYRIHEPTTGSSRTSLGEYEFVFPVRSGSVIGACPGFHYSWDGAFFLETNYKTYWINPDMDSSKNYYLDDNGYRIIEQLRGTYNPLATTRSELKYYNPRACSR